ncbi:MAG: hypothetical protein C0603_06415 [Denitrovibrio sp.]|nr:MAG: hypothetical protein C0603_06415 [Denitrovibrio sp.]
MKKQAELDIIRVDMTSEDEAILKSYKDAVDGIAAFFGKHCEVALHSLKDPEHAIIKIVNNQHTKRVVGGALSEHGLQTLLDFQKSGKQDFTIYTTSAANGEPMRTVQTVITNDGRSIGLLGINFNMSIPLAEFISAFSLFHEPVAPVSDNKDMMVADSVEDLIHNAVGDMVMDISTNINIPNHEKNKYIVYGLYEKGIFDIKGSVVMVAKELKLSKYTIYGYIRELKN